MCSHTHMITSVPQSLMHTQVVSLDNLCPVAKITYQNVFALGRILRKLDEQGVPCMS